MKAWDICYPNKDNRENYLKTVEFRYPEWIPCSVNLPPSAWKAHREKLEDLVVRHPMIFGSYEKGTRDFDAMPPVYRKGEYYTDSWGTVWYNIKEGFEGRVVKPPIEDWNALDHYVPPNPLLKADRGEWNWTRIAKWAEERRRKRLLITGMGERLFDRLYFLRGFRNLMIDIVTDAPQLPRLIGILEDYEAKLIKKWLEIGVDIIYFHTDIGTQNGLMISPERFRKYIKPMFKRLFTLCREAGTHVYLSSDGRHLDIVDDLVECGVSVHDPQFRANTLEGISRTYKGKMCVDIDLDRQMFPFCKPSDIEKHIKETAEKLSRPEGGLMMKAEVVADVPLSNIEAICKAMEKICLGK